MTIIDDFANFHDFNPQTAILKIIPNPHPNPPSLGSKLGSDCDYFND
jgi:hypothetical protein